MRSASRPSGGGRHIAHDMTMHLRVLSDRDGWLAEYIPILRRELAGVSSTFEVCEDHDPGAERADMTILFGYSRILPPEVLDLSALNVVIHASDLPRGRGWSPYIWDVLAGAGQITVSVIEAVHQIDAGDILVQERVLLTGTELLPEIRREIAVTAVRLTKRVVEQFQVGTLARSPQVGRSSYFRRRTPQDSRVDTTKSIEDQFDLLRTVDNKRFPAWFELRGRRYRLEIFPDE